MPLSLFKLSSFLSLSELSNFECACCPSSHKCHVEVWLMGVTSDWRLPADSLELFDFMTSVMSASKRSNQNGENGGFAQ